MACNTPHTCIILLVCLLLCKPAQVLIPKSRLLQLLSLKEAKSCIMKQSSIVKMRYVLMQSLCIPERTRNELRCTTADFLFSLSRHDDTLLTESCFLRFPHEENFSVSALYYLLMTQMQLLHFLCERRGQRVGFTSAPCLQHFTPKNPIFLVRSEISEVSREKR